MLLRPLRLGVVGSENTLGLVEFVRRLREKSGLKAIFLSFLQYYYVVIRCFTAKNCIFAG